MICLSISWTKRRSTTTQVGEGLWKLFPGRSLVSSRIVLVADENNLDDRNFKFTLQLADGLLIHEFFPHQEPMLGETTGCRFGPSDQGGRAGKVHPW